MTHRPNQAGHFVMRVTQIEYFIHIQLIGRENEVLAEHAGSGPGEMEGKGRRRRREHPTQGEEEEGGGPAGERSAVEGETEGATYVTCRYHVVV